MSLTGYLGIGALIALLSLGLVSYHYKVEARDAIAAQQAAERNLKIALDVNAENEKVMAAQEAARVKADKLTAELAAEIDAANTTTLALAKRLAELRTKDADVDAFLKLPVPPSLRGLYDDTATGGH